MEMLELERGSQLITLEQLHMIEPALPATNTFQPVKHADLAITMRKIATDMLSGFQLTDESYQVARYGAQMFSTLCFQKNDGEMPFCLGYRNATDKSMAIGVCMGASVMCCSNGVFSGEITVLKRHTANIWKNLEDLVITSLYRSNNVYDKVRADKEAMERVRLLDNDAYRLFGLLHGLEIISVRQLTTAINEWRQPSYADFADRTLWSAYNATTQALKTSPPTVKMEAHTRAHDVITAEYRII